MVVKLREFYLVGTRSSPQHFSTIFSRFFHVFFDFFNVFLSQTTASAHKRIARKKCDLLQKKSAQNLHFLTFYRRFSVADEKKVQCLSISCELMSKSTCTNYIWLEALGFADLKPI